ncbi:ATP-dependent DNA ligase [Streptomyces musisoli]|nr:hypothetical protein [Streptomyces musisoli]
MLAEAWPALPPERALPGGLVYEQKADGYRAVVFARPGHAYIQSRRGGDLTLAFPDLAAAVLALDRPLVLDGELVVVQDGRLHFGALQARARRRGRGAAQAAVSQPALLITGVRTGSGLVAAGVNEGSQQVGDPCSRRPTTV